MFNLQLWIRQESWLRYVLEISHMTQPEQWSGPLHPPVTRARPSTWCRARWVQPGCCLRITTQGCSVPIQESLVWIRPVSTRRFRCDTAQNNFKIIVFLGQKTNIFYRPHCRAQIYHISSCITETSRRTHARGVFKFHWTQSVHLVLLPALNGRGTCELWAYPKLCIILLPRPDHLTS